MCRARCLKLKRDMPPSGFPTAPLRRVRAPSPPFWLSSQHRHPVRALEGLARGGQTPNNCSGGRPRNEGLRSAVVWCCPGTVRLCAKVAAASHTTPLLSNKRSTMAPPRRSSAASASLGHQLARRAQRSQLSPEAQDSLTPPLAGKLHCSAWQASAHWLAASKLTAGDIEASWGIEGSARSCLSAPWNDCHARLSVARLAPVRPACAFFDARHAVTRAQRGARGRLVYETSTGTCGLSAQLLPRAYHTRLSVALSRVTQSLT